MKKILFFIHDLGQGGAEKVLINLVNNLDREKFDITVMALFGGGVNEQLLNCDIRYKTCFKHSIPGNSRIMKLFTPKQLHRFFIKEKYDIEISYLEGPSARIISGCYDKGTKLISWIHTKFKAPQNVYSSFRSKSEAEKCYQKYDYTAFVSLDVKENFLRIVNLDKDNGVLYNTIESDMILEMSKKGISIPIDKNLFNIVSVGTLKEIKGYDRLLRIAKRLCEEGYKFHLYILGSGPLEKEFNSYIVNNCISDKVTLLGYDSNPYKYVAKCDLFVCSSYTEGFSTAATEAIIVGTPVCTVDVSGMKELLGENNEYGIVSENTEEDLYNSIKDIINNPGILLHYREKCFERAKKFNLQSTVKAVEELLYN